MTASRTPALRDAANVPARCPSCGSRDVVTTSKTVDASTYWRCGACGEVWNASRHREVNRYASRHSFGR